MTRPELTPEQLLPATARGARTYVEAAPGSGKTFLAVERYGYLRFGLHARDHRGIGAVSFARSASAELLGRIVRRWGASAARWPNFVGTIDELHRRLLKHLIETGQVLWPGAPPDISVKDTWRQSPGARNRLGKAPGWWSVDLDPNGEVAPVLVSEGPRPPAFFTDRGAYLAVLETGRCTHDEVRALIGAALLRPVPTLREAIKGFLAASFVHLVVDEAFDMNELDIALVGTMAEGEVGVTVVGDPWQSLYEFRGSRPKLMATLVGDGFTKHSVLGSHRYRTDDMRTLARQLALGDPFAVAAAEPGRLPDVVLATTWSPLWEQAELPLLPPGLGGRIAGGPYSAALLILLNEVTTDRFGVAVTGFGEAAALLGWDGDRSRLVDAVGELAGGGDEQAIWTALKSGLARAGESWPAPGVIAGRRLARLVELVRGGPSVLALSVHQAKGLQWPAVDFLQNVMEPGERYRLDEDSQLSRQVYVALTRAQDSVRLRRAPR
ncbi:MAG TPA: UvrD-helicase domain-containing protein [Acidimicrobiales bacterium]|nr:UvrD-helicase domain-containing protein [Acidimicrobiales bacterium]